MATIKENVLYVKHSALNPAVVNSAKSNILLGLFIS